MQNPARRTRGFTLIELMITITIAAILMGVGIPAMTTMIQDNRRAAVVNDLVASIHLARNTAQLEGVKVIVCPRSGNACGGSWADGWLVFKDSENDNNAYDTADETLLASSGELPAGVTLTANLGFVSDLTYRRNRQATTGNFLVCPADGGTGRGRRITLTPAGHSRLTPADCP